MEEREIIMPFKIERDYVSKGKYFLGEYEGGKCYLKWELYNGKNGLCFSMSGERWESNKEMRRGMARDITNGGQCCDRIAAWFPKDAKAARMVEIWSRYHLNDMRTGTPQQMAFIKAWQAGGARYDYTEACKALEAAGLNPDPETGYKYGHAWPFEEIPAEIIAEIKAWKNPADMTADELSRALSE